MTGLALKDQFLKKSESMPHGFSAVVECRKGKYGTSWKCRDNFSCACIERNGITILVQAGVLSDESTEAIYKKYKENPNSFMPSRNTDGSFLIIDPANGRIVLGRDRSQTYHIYLVLNESGLYISTSVLPFMGTICKELDPAACDLYLTYGIVIGPFPLLKNLQALLPGHYLKLDWSDLSNTNRLKKPYVFWEIEPAEVPKSYGKATAQYGELLCENIQRHLKDSSAGVFLSGGSDSAAVVGILNKLNCRQVVTGHMAIPGFFDDAKTLVKRLQEAYKFQLKFIEPDFNSGSWLEEVNKAIRINQPGSYVSFPAYRQTGLELGSQLPEGTTVFNGELCLLDQGFNEASDHTRKFRRWLYMNAGRLFSNLPALWPNKLGVNWGNHRKSIYRKENWRDVIDILATFSASFLRSLGRPGLYYAGAKAGFRGFPGIWAGKSYLSKDYEINLAEIFYERFFSNYEKRLAGPQWRQALATMTLCWYSEATNLTMPLDAAASGGNPVCFPFNSVELMDFAVSCPVPWCIDKKIQKDMCYHYLSMPEEIAYYLKDHTIKGKTYFEIVYENIRKEITERVRDTDYGPLQAEIDKNLSLGDKDKKRNDELLFDLYCLSICIEELGNGAL